MKLAIMQPYLFPYIGYFQLVNLVDKFVMYNDVAFINKGWINRNNILVNGCSSLFTVPLKKASQNRLIKDIELANEINWQHPLLRKLEFAYKKAPFYTTIAPLVEGVILSAALSINDLAVASIKAVSSYLNLQAVFVNSSGAYNNSHLKAQYRILDICKQENALNYINPIGGIEIYSKGIFEEAGIRLNFLKTKSYCYRQFSNTFVPHLSIIDVLMFNDKNACRQLLTEFELL